MQSVDEWLFTGHMT